MTAKIVKYPEEFVAILVAEYVAREGYEAEQAFLKEAAAAYPQYKVAGLRAKLVQAGVYNAKVATKAGTATVRKAELVTQLAALIEVPEIEIGTFEKATKEALETVVGRVRAMVEVEEV